MPEPTLRTTVKIYLEDTDAQGIVYHANYLKFFERARTDWIDERGIGLKAAQDRGFRFVVYAVEVKFLRPAMLADRLEITTEAKRTSPFRIVFKQQARRAGETAPITTASIDIVCIGANGQLVEISQDLLAID